MDERPWFAHYGADTPRSLAPYPERTLLDYVSDHATAHPDHTAVIFSGARLSYGELEAASDALAAALAAGGLRRGDRVALLLPNSPQFVIAELASWKAGAIVVPLNPLYSEQELTDALNRVGATVVIVLTRFYGAIKRIQPKTKVARVVATNIKDYLPRILRLLYTLLRERREGDRVACMKAMRGYSTSSRISPALRRHGSGRGRTTRPRSCSAAAPPVRPRR
jgi:long-chain acyl-CoA synthetase